MAHLTKIILTAATATALTVTAAGASENWEQKDIAITYQTKGKISGINYTATSKLALVVGTGDYNISLKTKILGLYKVEQKSHGQFAAATGFKPLRYAESDKKYATFNYHTNTIAFSKQSRSEKLQPGAQDRLSALFQLGFNLSRNTEVTNFQISSPRNAPQWKFDITTTKLDGETVIYASGHKVGDNNNRINIWLSPKNNYLPIKMQLHKANGDFTEQKATEIKINNLK